MVLVIPPPAHAHAHGESLPDSGQGHQIHIQSVFCLNNTFFLREAEPSFPSPKCLSPPDLFFVCLFFLFFVFFGFAFFGDRVSLCSPGCPGTHSVDQAGLELRNPPVSASQVLGLKACATTARPEYVL